MQILVYDALFWITVGIYIGIRMMVIFFGDIPPYLQDVPADSIAVLGGFMSFFLVFWVRAKTSAGCVLSWPSDLMFTMVVLFGAVLSVR